MGSKRATTINQRHFKVKAHADIDNEACLASLWIEIPDHCHLQCGYCFADTRRNQPHLTKDHLKVDEYLKMIDDFAASGGKYLGIPGNGEPFHPANRNLVRQILRRATDKGLSTTVFTTGDAIFWKMLPDKTFSECVSTEPDYALMDEMMTYDIILLVKCNSIKDDKDEEGYTIQDRLVGQSGYTQARKKAMEILINKYKLNKKERLGIVTSIMPENKDEIVKLFEYAKEKELIFDCDTILPRGRGKKFLEGKKGKIACDSSKDRISPQEYKAIYKALEEVSGENFSVCGSYVGVACDRIKHHLYIDIKGDAYPCIGCVGRKENLCLGNIRDMPIKDIWDSPIRSLLRDDYKTVVFGPCSNCYNFQVSCFSCLGRSVKKFEVHENKIVLHTKGCFNHRPRWAEWTRRCKNFIINMISDTDIPREIQDNLVESVKDLSLVHFWRDNCELTGQPYRKEGYPDILKDLSYSNINFQLASIWDIVPDKRKIKEQVKGMGTADSFKDRYNEKCNDIVRTLLPRLLLTSLKLIYEECNHDEKRNHRFTPKEDFESSNKGLIQFTNLMFYLPGEGKSRYIYRTISHNSLDPFVMALPENFGKTNGDTADKINQKVKIRNREVRLIQRWAETFERNQKAPILKHIRNLSRDLEDERTDTYELLLTKEVYNDCRVEIDRDIRHNNKSIIAIFPLLELDAIKKKVKVLHNLVCDIVEDDVKWKNICNDISNKVFIDSGDIFNNLKNKYMSFANNAFYKYGEITKEDQNEILNAITRIIAINTIFFPDSSEASWCDGDIQTISDKIDWKEFHEVLCRDFYKRGFNEESCKLLACYDKVLSQKDRNIVNRRLYNPLIRLVVNHFIDADFDNGEFCEGWEKAINYFIWLSYFKEYLNVHSYFVHHPPNLSRYYSKFANIRNNENNGTSTPCGIIISSNGRLPSYTKEQIINIFNSIMVPLEELIQSIDVIEKQSSETKEMAFRNAGHIMKNRTIAPGDALSDIYDMDTQQLKTDNLEIIEQKVYYALRDTKSLFNLYQASRLWGFRSLEDLVQFYNEHSDTPELRVEKKKQFLSYEGCVDLRKVIEEVGQYCTHGAHFNNKTKQETFYTLQTIFNVPQLSIYPDLDDSLDGKCCLNHDVLSAIFYEFLLNAFNHAYLPNTTNGQNAIKRLTIDTSVIFEKPVITLTNNCDTDKRLHTSGFIEATEIPEKGIGMINSILTSIECGRIWHKRYQNDSDLDTYTVAVHLNGLRTK